MTEYDSLEFCELEVAPALVAQVTKSSATDPAAIAEAMGAAFGDLVSYLQANGLTPAGPPRAIYTSYGPEGTAFLVAFPIAEPAVLPPASGAASVQTLPGRRAYRFTHRGSYPTLGATYGRITQFMTARGLMENEMDWARYMPMWEEYMNDPTTTAESDLLTYIYLPLS